MEWHGAMAVAFKALTTGTGKVTKKKKKANEICTPRTNKPWPNGFILCHAFISPSFTLEIVIACSQCLPS